MGIWTSQLVASAYRYESKSQVIWVVPHPANRLSATSRYRHEPPYPFWLSRIVPVPAKTGSLNVNTMLVVSVETPMALSAGLVDTRDGASASTAVKLRVAVPVMPSYGFPAMSVNAVAAMLR